MINSTFHWRKVHSSQRSKAFKLATTTLQLLSSVKNILQPMHFICWIATYPLDKVICSLNNWGQVLKGKAYKQENLYFKEAEK